MVASANFTVNGSAVPPEVAVAALSVVTLALSSVSGVDTVAWSIIGNHSESAVNPVITSAGTPLGATATFTMPAGAAQGYIIQCQINGGVDSEGVEQASYTKTALVGVLNTASVPMIPFAFGETFERSATHGYTKALNDFVDSGGTGLIVSGSPAAGDVPTWSGSSAVWAPKSAYDITSFAHANTLYEVGTVLANPAFTAAHSQTPDTLLLTNNQNVESKDVHATPTSFTSSQSYTFATPSYSVTWTLTGTKITSDVATRTASAAQKSFWGISTTPANTEAFVEALASSALDTDAARSFTVNATSTNKIYFAHPTRYGTPTFTVGGFEGGFTLRSSTISVTNAQGYTENYSLWESDVAGLGSTTVVVS